MVGWVYNNMHAHVVTSQAGSRSGSRYWIFHRGSQSVDMPTFLSSTPNTQIRSAPSFYSTFYALTRSLLPELDRFLMC